jgi:superoxide oxidase
MRSRYSMFVIVLHWTTALLVVGAYIVSKGAREVRLDPPTLHFALGLSVLLLVVPRVVARTFADKLPVATPTSWFATWAHRALYLLLIAVPLSGWYAASRLGVEISISGLTVPPIAHAVNGRPGPIAGLHSLGGNLLLLLAGLHAAMGLWHHLVRRDGTLGRMSPFRRSEPPVAP